MMYYVKVLNLAGDSTMPFAKETIINADVVQCIGESIVFSQTKHQAVGDKFTDNVVFICPAKYSIIELKS